MSEFLEVEITEIVVSVDEATAVPTVIEVSTVPVGAQGPEGEVDVVQLTQVQYDALPVKDPETFYVITDSPAPLAYTDTGWRDIKVSSGLTTSAVTLAIRRTGNTVRLWCEQLERAAPYVNILAIPVGFWSMSTTHHFMRDDTITGHWGSFLSNGSDFMFINALSTYGAFTTASRFGGTIQWVTDQAWPVSLPGTVL